MTEEQLPGGRTVGAVRIGDTVHRPVQPWTPAVHAVLRHLEAVGFEGAPRVLGFDEQGREVLTHLPGETVGNRRTWPRWTRSDDALRQVGTWLRTLHDVTAGFAPPPGLRWFAGQSWRPGLVIGHHDAAPFNAVWSDGRLRGFFDWDTAGPSSREVDLAFVALSWVPLFARRAVAEHGFTAFEDRSRRLHLLLDAYGFGGDRHAFRAAVAGRARVNAVSSKSGRRQAIPPTWLCAPSHPTSNRLPARWRHCPSRSGSASATARSPRRWRRRGSLSAER